jgi:hypothetical protein
MIDYGTRHTDLALKRLEARLRAVYRQAEKDIAAKTEDYWKRHAARDEKYRQQVKDGKLSREDYEAWQRGQVFQGKQWESKRQSIEDVLYNADSTALQMINDGKMDVFTAGANYMGYELEQHGRIDTGFNLYDGPTVTRLLKDDPQILPKARVKKEKAYVWYNKLVNNCVLQGIIQGESINEIAARIGRTTGERTESAMKRNALTAYTGAQNAGRIEGMKQAQQMGIDVKKRWIATMDSRTRDAHRDLDGKVQDVDKPFKSSLGDIMYPGDPTAKPGNVYNCHCAVGSAYPKYPAAMTRRDAETGEVVGDMKYREWEAMKQGGGQALELQIDDKPKVGNEPDDELVRFGSALQGATNAAEFWMNMDANQMDAFNASGENIYDFYNRLHDKASPETLEMPEWKPDAPGGTSNYQLSHDYSESRIDVSQIPARSEGWMAGAETTGIINVREGGFDDWQYVIGHEAGHQLANYNPELQRTIVDNPGGLLGRYNQKRGFFDGAFGEYNAEEAWADAVSSYVNSPRRFQKQYPELYDAVDGFFKSSPSARDFIDRTYAAYRRAVGL